MAAQIVKIFLLGPLIFLNWTDSVYAMHIAEGMLRLKWSVFWWGASIPFIIIGLVHIQKLKKLRPLYLPLLSTTAAVVFVFSLLPLPVPITGTTSHATVIGLSVLLLGVFSTCVVSFISLILQSVFLGHGGLTTLGANVFSMGIVGSIVGLFTFYFLKNIKVPWGIRVFLVSFFADISTYISTAFQLSLSLATTRQLTGLFMKFVLIFLPVQLPVAILEGLLTVGIIKYISEHKPNIIEHII